LQLWRERKFAGAFMDDWISLNRLIRLQLSNLEKVSKPGERNGCITIGDAG
jgi:hypothetical protein